MFQNSEDEIQKADSPGFVPIRAIAFALLDTTFPFQAKYSKLYREGAMRSLRGFFSNAGAAADESLANAVVSDKSQVFRVLVEELSGERIADFLPQQQRQQQQQAPHDVENDNNAIAEPAKPKRPLQFLSASDLLAKATRSEADFEALMRAHEKTVVRALRSVFVEKLQHWEEFQRVVFAFSCLGSHLPITELNSRFSRFVSVEDLVERTHTALAGKQEKLKGVLWSFLADQEYCVLKSDADGEVSELLVGGGGEARRGWTALSVGGQRALRECFSVLCSLWSWNGSAQANAHGLSPIDWEVVAAFDDPSAVHGTECSSVLCSPLFFFF